MWWRFPISMLLTSPAPIEWNESSMKFWTAVNIAAMISGSPSIRDRDSVTSGIPPMYVRYTCSITRRSIVSLQRSGSVHGRKTLRCPLSRVIRNEARRPPHSAVAWDSTHGKNPYVGPSGPGHRRLQEPHQRVPDEECEDVSDRQGDHERNLGRDPCLLQPRPPQSAGDLPLVLPLRREEDQDVLPVEDLVHEPRVPRHPVQGDLVAHEGHRELRVAPGRVVREERDRRGDE